MVTQQSIYFTVDEVAKHNKYEDCWIILGEPGERKVYDVTGFLDDHPGGPEILMDLAGQDSHEEFEDIGHSKDARDKLPGLCIGLLDESKIASSRSRKSSTKGGTGSTLKDTSSSNNLVFLAGAVLVVAFGWLFYPVE